MGSVAAKPELAEPARAKIRVAAVLDTWIVSGPGRQLAALSLGLREAGVNLHIIIFQRRGRSRPPFADYLQRLGVNHSILQDAGPFDISLFGRLRHTLQEIAPDIVQSHGYRPTAMVAALRLRKPTWKWIGFFHGATQVNLKDRLYNKLNFILLPLADRIVVLSEEHRGWFAKIGERVRVIHNAVLSLPDAPKREDFSKLRRHSGAQMIGVIARLSHEKGVDLLLEAMALLRKRAPATELAIAGDGPEEAWLRAQAERLGQADNVRFLGRVDDMIGLYKALDIVVIPSRAGAEGLPNVLLEALRADRPVVATRVAAVPEVLVDPAAGLVVEPGDVAGLAAAIEQTLASGATETSQAARKRVLERFSLATRISRHLALYDELLSPGATGMRIAGATATKRSP